jgi:tetratricopeptide (TPR) repeat protein
MPFRTLLAPPRRALRVALLLAAASAASLPDGVAAADDLFQGAAGNYLAARHAERVRDHDAVANFLARALAREPGNFDLLLRSHAALVNRGAFDEAVAAARRIVDTSVANAAANLTLAVDAARGDRWDEAARFLTEVPLQGINRLLVPILRAWIDAARGRENALDQIRPLADLPDIRTIVDFHSALIHDRLGRVAQAEELFRRLVGNEGRAAPRVIEAAVSFFVTKGRVAEARAILETARATYPDSLALEMAQRSIEGASAQPFLADARAGFASALFDVATAVRGEGDGGFSLPYARLAMALSPDDAAVLLLIGDILDQQERMEDANRFFARIAPEISLGWSARLRMAENLHRLGRTEEGVALLEAMSGERPERVDALITLGGLKRVQEKFADAAQVYDRAVARIGTPERRHWSLFYARGISLERSKQWPRAEADFKKALELQPEQPDVMNYLAYSWVDQGQSERYDAALKMLERAVELRPNSGHIIDSLAWALYRLGRYAEAVPLLERAVELLPQEAVLLDHLGDVYWKVGRIAEARYQWRRALDSKPEADLKPQLEKKLKDGLEATSEKPRGG